MKRSLAVLTVSLGLALSGCGGGGGSDYSTLSKKQLSASLLTVDDLGSGWKRDKDSADSEDDDLHVLKGNASCKKLFPKDDDDENEVDSADVSFTKDDFAPFFAEEIITQKPGTAEEDFRTVGEAIKGCRTFVSDLDESKPIVTLRPAEGPDLGDESLAFTFTAKIPDVPAFKARGIAVRLGDNVVTLLTLGLEGKEIASAELKALVEKSVANVEKRAAA